MNHDITPSQGEGPSLLWPPTLPEERPVGQPTGLSGCTRLDPAAVHDLNLETLVAAFTAQTEHQREILAVLTNLCQDPITIRHRQDVIADLLRYPQLAASLERLLPTIDALGRFSLQSAKDMTTLHELTWRVGELQSIADCIQGLGEVFAGLEGGLASQGWRSLQAEIERIRRDPVFQNLVQELPGLLAQLRTSASVTIGVNLDQFLRPVEATLLSVNEDKFTNQSILTRMFGSRTGLPSGITPLHTVPRRQTDGQYALPVSSDLGWAVEPLMVPLFKDLAEVIEKTTRPIAKDLRRYTEIHGRLFIGLRRDLIFYLGALRFIRRLQGHRLAVCRPEIVAPEERVCVVEGAYNAGLALRLSEGDPDRDLRAAVVCNDIRFDAAGRILILTGPNQGGKTTYLQGAGLVQVLAQAGLHVPGKRARISPVDNIYSHFPIEERPDALTGRFGDEAKRLSEIFHQITPHSLVLLNESLSSTNAGESLYLAQDLVRILRRIGGRALYSTHLHELAARTEELNASTPGDSPIVSLVASPIEVPAPGESSAAAPAEIRRSYHITARPPIGRSYAQEIARRYGIDYEQMEQALAERGILPKA